MGLTLRAIHQFLPNLDYGDAISVFALELREIVQSHGFRSRVYVRYFDPRLRAECADYRRYDVEGSPDDLILYHYSVGSEITKYFAALPNRKAIIYHNITPADFFLSYNLTLYNLLRQGREELARLATVPALCYSEYSAQELRELGFSMLHSVPVLWNTERFDRKPDPKVLSTYGDDRWNILFVGRVAPNKRHEDLIKVFHLYTRHLNAKARLILVGSYRGLEGYHRALLELAGNLGVENVVFTGKARLRELVAYYRVAGIFLSMSEHEGFGVPLLEAMHFGLPIVAYSACAVPFTLDGAGVLVREKDYAEVAELIELIRTDEALRNRIVAGQRARLRELVNQSNRDAFWKTLEGLCA